MAKGKVNRKISVIMMAMIVSILTQAFLVQSVHAAGILGGPRAELGGQGGTELFLGGKYIELGISNWGDFGTLGNKPANFRGTYGGETAGGSNQIGMSADHDGFGIGRDLPIDYYLPGTPEERFAVGYQIGLANFSKSNSAQMGVTQMPTTVQNLSDIDQGLLKAKTVSIWPSIMEVTQIISFATNDKFYRNEVTLKNISTQTWDGARYMRSFDPDNTQFRGGPFATANTVTHTIAEDGKAVVKAETYSDSDPLYKAFGSRSPIFFYSNDPKAVVSAYPQIIKNPYEKYVYEEPREKGIRKIQDEVITITWDPGLLSPNDSKTFVYYTSLDERDFARVQGEIIVADIKKEIEDAEDMDDVKEIKKKIDKEKDLEEEKKKELKTIVVDDICDYPSIKDLPLRDDKDIILVKDLIDESDKTDEEKDDVREKLVDKAMRDIKEPTDKGKDAIEVVANDITDAGRKENTKAKIAVAAAKKAIVDGTVKVKMGATPEEITAAVQAYVNSLLIGDAAGVTAIVTHESGSNYKVKISKGSIEDEKTITMTIKEVTELEAAIDAVITAEGTKTDATKSAAQQLVTALVDGKEKTDLQGRLGLIITVEDKARELATAKENAQVTLESYVDTANYKTNADGLVLAIATGKTKIDEATTLDEVATALANAKLAIDAIESDAAIASRELATAKENAQVTLESYVDTANYKTNADALVLAIATGKTKIDEATTLDEVATALANAKLAIDAIESDAAIASRELATAKENAQVTLESYVDTANYKTNADALVLAIATGKTKIDEATTLDQVATALANAKLAIDAIESDAAIASRELATAKENAQVTLESYVDGASYKTNADDLALAIATGKTKIDEATTLDQVATALANAKLAIDAIESDAAIASRELATAKENAQVTLESYVDTANYKTNADALVLAIATGKTKIDEATTLDQVATALANAKLAIDAIESDAAIASRELATAKENAQVTLESYVDGASYKTNADDLALAIATGKTKIDEATTLDQVATALANAKLAIDAIESDAAIASRELATAKENAQVTLESYVDTANYKTNADALVLAIATGKTKIDEATTLDEVATALANAKLAIDAIESDAAIASRELATAKENAQVTLESYVDGASYKTNADGLALAIATGKTKIDEATTLDEVATALANAKLAIDAIESDAAIASRELATAKENAQVTLESYVDTANYKTNADALVLAIATGKTKIDEATTLDQVATALANAKLAIDAIESDAAIASRELATAKENAQVTLESYVDTANYKTNADALVLAIATGKTKIDEATTLDQVATALANAKLAIDAIESDAAIASRELATAKENAQVTLESYVDTANYKTNADGLALAIATGKTKIDEVTTLDEVATALANAKLAIDAIESDAAIASRRLAAATKAVEIAEEAKTDATKSSAQALVTALPEGTEKTDLQNRLDAITTTEDKEKADKTAAGTVDSLITDLPESGSVVIEDKDQIEEARTSYDDLTEDQKNLVTDVEKLEGAEAELSVLKELAAALQAAAEAVATAEETKTNTTKTAAQDLVTALPEGTDKTDLQNRLEKIITTEEKEKADQAAADDVNELITSLPESGSVVIEDKDQIEEARTSYDDLTEDQKNLVTDVEKLEGAEAELSALEELAAALQAATKAVETAEEAKTDATKSSAQDLVTALPEGTDKTDLQNRLDAITTTEDEEKTDQSVADGVNELITSLPKPGSVKIEDKDQIEEARTSYDDLTEDQKKLVKDVEALEVAEAELSALEELAAALQAATEAVATAEETKTDAAKASAQALITALPEGTEKAALQEKLNAIVTEETTELASSKTIAKTSLKDYVNPADYKTNATSLASAITTGKTNIDAATTTDEVATALANAKRVIDAIESDIKTIEDAKIVVQDANYLDINQEEETSETAIEKAVKATATATVNDKSINVTVNKVNYIAPIAGTSANPDATNGSYEFTVTVSKGEHTQTTEATTITIIAKPFTGVTDTQAVEMAKTAIVAGSVDVIFGATQEEKIAAVQTYVNGLLKDNENGVTATVTHESENDYIISISKGSTEETVTIEMVTNESEDPDIAQVNYAKDAVENVVYPDMSQMAGADEAAIANVIIQAAQMVVTDSAITLTLNKVSHTAPIAGTPENPKGTDGSYTFAVIVNKGEQTQTTTQKTITIKAIELIMEPLTLVTISGTARVGETISAAVHPSEATVDYEWKSNGITVGGNSPTYTAQEWDIGKRITVTATGTGIYSGTVISTQTSEIEPKRIPNHTVSGVIKDTNNNPISDATVKVTDKNDPSKTYTDKTDLNGNYTIAVPDGNYTITISKANEKLGNTEITITGQDIIGGDSDITVAAPVITTYTVAYNANGGTGIIPTDNLFYAKGAYARILSKGNLTRLDYTFTDWNTQIDGKGISYKANDRFVMTANTTLYAQWKKIVSAEIPKFTANNVRGTETVVQATNATQISVTAGVSDGGTLTYQWYKNTKNTTIGGTEISGETNQSYTPPTDALGTTYYYVVVTNTLNVDGQTTKTSNICGVKEEIVLAKPAELYNISTITGSVLDHLNLSNTSATQYQTYITTLGVENGYKLPAHVIVKIAGITQVAGTDYNYSKETGNLTVYNVTDQLTIEATGILIPIQYYTISFNSNGGNAVAAISQVYGTPVTLPIPSKAGFIFTGWYQEKGLATSYISPTMGDENTTLYAQWKQVIFDIKGNIVDEDHQDIKGATVKLMSGSRKVAEEDTDENGKFTISGVPSGTYNLVIIKDDQTITLVITVSDNNIALGYVTLPKGKKNSVVDVKPNTPDIIVDKLNNFFDSSAFTQDDSNIVDTGGKVEIKLVVEKKDESGDNVAANMENIKTAIESTKTIGMFLDLTVSKIVTPKDNTAEKPILISELDDLLVIEIPLPAQMQGKSEYVIYRYHGSEVQTITQTKNADGEYIELSADGTTIKLHTKKFSTYAIGYNKTTVTPPASSGDDDQDNFDISNKKQIITTEATEGGKVSQNGKTIIITADTGYKIEDVLVDGKSVGPVKTYTFEDTISKHTIKVVFTKEITAEKQEVQEKEKQNPFKDIKDNDWFFNTVLRAYEMGLMVGTSEDTFNPYAGTTRGMIATMIHRLEKEESTNSKKTKFDDVNTDQWYAEGIAWGNEKGIVVGYEDGSFKPDQNITRQELCAIIKRYGTYKGYDMNQSANLIAFSDHEEISSWALESVKWTVGSGIMKGKENKRLDPKGVALRAEVCAMLLNLLDISTK